MFLSELWLIYHATREYVLIIDGLLWKDIADKDLHLFHF